MQFSIRIYNIFLIGIVLCLRRHYVEGKPSLHFGRCKSSLVSVGFCRSLKDCSILNTDQKEDEDLLRQLRCDSNLQNLICCPINEISPDPVLFEQVLPQPPHCGGMIVGDKIFNGERTVIDEFPWMAIVLYNDADEGRMCGGTLITDQYVLTAAHCVDRKLVSGVRLGEWNLRTNPDCQKSRLGNEDCAPSHIDIDVSSTTMHPDYQASGSYPNDIALLQLVRTVRITDWIRPICLPPVNDVDADVNAYDGLRMSIAGWGRSEWTLGSSPLMLKAEVPVWSKNKCEDFATSHRFQLKERQICAGNASGSCHGDSGGPLMQEKSNQRIYQIGIISLGGNCKAENRPAIFTEVAAYVDWIIKEIVKATLVTLR